MQNPRQIIVEDENTEVAYHNGAIFIARHVKDAPTFSATSVISAGSYDDDMPGTAHCFEHMPFGKSQNYQDEEAVILMQKMGGRLDASTGRDRTFYKGLVRNQFHMQAIDIVSDVTCRAILEENRLGPELETILDEWAFNEMRSDLNYSEVLRHTAYGDNPLLHPITGTEESIRQITLPILQNYFNTSYVSNQLIVAMEGDVEPQRVLDRAIEKFQLPQGLGNPVHPVIEIKPRTHFVGTAQKATKVAAILQRPPFSSSCDTVATHWVLGEMLSNISGTLFQEMRFGKRLVYSVGTQESQVETNYCFDAIGFAALPQKVPSAVEAMAVAIKNCIQTPNTALFEQIKETYIFENTQHLKRNSSREATNLVYDAHVRGKIEAFDAYTQAMQRLRIEDVIEAGRAITNSGKVSLLYTGQHRDNYPDHNDLIDMLRTSSSDQNVHRHHQGKSDSTP